MKRTPLSLLRRWLQPARRRPITRTRLALEALEQRLAPSTDVLTYHYDAQGSGANTNETALTPSNVTVNSFERLMTTGVDGQVYAEPLVQNNVNITTGSNAGVHNVVFAATENDSVYAIDANDPNLTGTVLWQRTFLDVNNPNDNTLGATAISTVSSGDVNTGDISPQIGITGTPVIDGGAGILYVVAKTKETINNQTYFVQRLHALNTADGTDVIAPYLLGTTTNGNTNNTQIFVYGNGDGSVTDPYYGTGKQVVQFNALRENQRGALNLNNGNLYVEWASHGDNSPYHGWVVEFNAANLKSTGWQLTGVLNTSPNGGLTGIWEGGGRLSFDPDENAFYFETGNGPTGHGNPTLNAAGFPIDGNYYEAVVKVVPDATTTAQNQNINGWGMKVSDYFIPYNIVALDNADDDLGSGAPLVLPDSMGITGHARLMVAAGKEGKIYVIDRDSMGHFNPNGDNVLNAVPNGSGQNTAPVLIGGSLSTPAVYNNTLYWVSGYTSNAYAYTLNSSGILSASSQTTISNFGYVPGSVIVSANGSTGGVVWIMDRNLNELHAYDASTLNTELWNSSMRAGGADSVGTVVKFAAPTEADGQVFVGTTNSLVIYGLAVPATAVPNAPTNLTPTPLSSSSINLTWQDTTASPNQATSYSVEEAVGNGSFSAVATAPAGATSIAIGNLQSLTTYSFRIRGQNSLGYSQYSNVATATTTNQAALIDFSGGFANSASQVTYNGSAAINGTKGELTNDKGNEAGSFFYDTQVDVTGFQTQFTFQISPGSNTADGMTFCIQNNAPTALGATGGGLAYSGINHSVAVKFDLYNNSGEGNDSTGLYTNGAAPSVPAIDLSSTGINLHSGDTFQVNMAYANKTLTVVIQDTSTGAQASQTYSIDIPGTIGNQSAYVGFTGGTGGLTATQDVLTWTYVPTAATSPNAPSGLGATPASATSVNLTWTNNATNQVGFHLDRATDSGFTQNLITETLPASPDSYTDTAAGLMAGGTYYYRIRAYNSAGDSGNSTPPASVTIPLPPPVPTNASVTNVTTSGAHLQWTDNAGHQCQGYYIERRIGNSGNFTTVATLPPTSRTPPDSYFYDDTNLMAGTSYQYEIICFNVSGNNGFASAAATTLTNPPSNVKATAGSAVVTLNWTAPTGAVSYNVYRATTAGGEGTTPYATGITTTSYTDNAVTNGTTYYYTVTALNGNASPLPAESAQSAEVSATPTAVPAPTNLRAIPTPANVATPQVSLSWTASAGATSYNVYRSTHGGAETLLTSGVTGTRYTDTSAALAFGTTYFYTVAAVAGGSVSNFSNEASATPLFTTRVSFSSTTASDSANGYLTDVGSAYGARGNGQSFGWNQDNTANGVDRNSTNAPNEQQDSFAQMQAAGNPNASWAIAVPNGTYKVNVTVGDPSAFNSVYVINVNGQQVLSGTPTASKLWFQTVTPITVTNGQIQVTNGTGAQNNKIDYIIIAQTLAGANYPNFKSTAGLQLNGSAAKSGTVLQLTNGGTNQAGSAFTTTAVDVAKFTTSFNFQLVNPNAEGFTFTIQNSPAGAAALGPNGGGLGYGGTGGITNSVAIKFDLANTAGEGNDSTGVYLNGAAPTVPAIDLTNTGINLHSGDVFNVAMGYDGDTLTVTIKDTQTGATATQKYVVDIVGAVGSTTAYVGFTGSTGSQTATQNIRSWTFTPQP
jgi:fibronectin type 3 domain-containing protein